MTLRNVRYTMLLLFSAAVFAGCSGMSVNFDYDQNVSWHELHTFGWLEAEQPAPNSVAGTKFASGLLDKRIREALAYELADRQVKPGDNPDILIKYYVATEEKIQVTDWGYRYSDYYWGYGGRQIDVNQFTEGTLVVDIVRADDKTLIWRGSATGRVDGGQRSPAEQQERVNNVVNKIMANFPPQ